MKPQLHNIPPELHEYNQWIFWRMVDGVKIPFMSKHKLAKTNDPKTWLTWLHVQDWEKLGFTGIGFVLSHELYTMIDLDNCCESIEPGLPVMVNDYARKVIRYFNSYTEISPSGNGIRIIVRGKIERAIKRKEIEAYYKERYMALTGWRIWSGEIEDRQTQLDKLVEKYAPKEPKIIADNKDMKLGKEFKPWTRPIENGERHHELVRLARFLLGRVSTKEYYYRLHETNRRCCRPPLSEKELEKIGRGVLRFA